jgi:hypothetical protein
MIKTTTIHHAAHYQVSRGGMVAYDQIQVDSTQDRPMPAPGEAEENGCEYHHGYRLGDEQHFVYVKNVKATEGTTCKTCNRYAKKGW